jgi:CubicO group peptidase (beta-lactamase class C family)
MTPDTLFELGSIGKSATATTFGWLADEGVVALGARVKDIDPAFATGADDVTESVTLSDVLAHVTGMPPFHALMSSGAVASRESLYLRHLPHLPAVARPRERPQYNSLMYVAASAATERRLDRSWEDLQRAFLIQRVGLARVHLDHREALQQPDVSQPQRHDPEIGHRAERRVLMLPLNTAAGTLSASGRDLAKLMYAQLVPGALSSDRLRTLHATVYTTDEIGHYPRAVNGEGWGLGWVSARYSGERVLTHGAGIPGTAFGRALIVPRRRLGICVFSNGTAHGFAGCVVFQLLSHLMSGRSDERLCDEYMAIERARAATRRSPQGAPATDADIEPGAYEHPGLGRVELLRSGEDQSQLVLRYGDLATPLLRSHTGALFAVFRQPQPFAVQVIAHGDALRVRLEPELEPLRFQAVRG